MRLSNGVLLVVLFFPMFGVAEQPAAIPWEELERTEQRILGNAESMWNSYSAERQQKLLRGARKWRSMSRAERQRMHRNLQNLQAMDPARKARVLHRLQLYKTLPPAERKSLRRAFRHYKRLPTDRRQELRKKWQERSPAERREMRRELNRRQREHRGDAADPRPRHDGPKGRAEGARRRNMDGERVLSSPNRARSVERRRRHEAPGADRQ